MLYLSGWLGCVLGSYFGSFSATHASILVQYDDYCLLLNVAFSFGLIVGGPLD